MSKDTSTSSAKQEVLDFVRAACPWTMKLKFGCRVKTRPSACRGRKSASSALFIGSHNEQLSDIFLPATKRRSKWQNHRLEILGTDMNLSELKRALPCESSTNDSIEVLRYFVNGNEVKVCFDLDQNLHNQKQQMYEDLALVISSLSSPSSK